MIRSTGVRSGQLCSVRCRGGQHVSVFCDRFMQSPDGDLHYKETSTWLTCSLGGETITHPDCDLWAFLRQVLSRGLYGVN